MPINAAELENRVTLDLPEYAPAGRIGLSMDRIDRLAYLGGFAEVQISSYSGEQTQHQHYVVGHDSQGAAYAGAGATKKARLSDPEFTENSRGDIVHSRPPLALPLNMREIEQRVSSQGGLRNADAWAHHLNAGIAEGLRNATWRHYVGHMQYGEVITFIASRVFNPFDPIVTPIGFNIGKALVARLFEGVHPRDVCWSLVPGIHPDRALMVSGLSRVMRVAKGIS